MQKFTSSRNFDLMWARLHVGISQEDLADAMGVHRTTVARWESGTRKIPQSRWVQALAILDLKEADIPAFATPENPGTPASPPKITPAGEKPKATNASAAPTTQTAKETWADFDNDYLEDTALFAAKQALAFREFMKDEAVVNAEEVVGIMVNYMPVDDTTLKQAVAVVTKALNRLTIAGKLERIRVPYPGSTETATVWRLPGDLV